VNKDINGTEISEVYTASIYDIGGAKRVVTPLRRKKDRIKFSQDVDVFLVPFECVEVADL